MNASRSPMFDVSVSTRIIKLQGNATAPWVVCTLDAVPVILARFENRAAAQAWQQGLGNRRQAA